MDPAQSAGKLIEAGIINEAIGSLNHRDQKIVRLRFGFTDRPHTLEEVGNIFGVTREAIRMLQDRALRKLRGKLQDGHPEPQSGLRIAGLCLRRQRQRCA